MEMDSGWYLVEVVPDQSVIGRHVEVVVDVLEDGYPARLAIPAHLDQRLGCDHTNTNMSTR